MKLGWKQTMPFFIKKTPKPNNSFCETQFPLPVPDSQESLQLLIGVYKSCYQKVSRAGLLVVFSSYNSTCLGAGDS